MPIGAVLRLSSRSGAYHGLMSSILVSFAIAWPGAASLTAGSAALSGARLVDAAVSLLFVLWLSRFAARLQARREAEWRDKVVPFPQPRAE